MTLSHTELRRELQQAGIATSAINAVWPQWWSEEAAGSVSATAELTYTVARRLGLSPRALFDGSAQFLWRDETKFKKLDAKSSGELAALASFGIAVGRAALAGTDPVEVDLERDAVSLRQIFLDQGHLVDARQLSDFCWAVGIPILQLRIFPLGKKRMHAMTVQVNGRYAILLAHEHKYSATVAYLIAHELGHILLNHLVGSDALLEGEDPLTANGRDAEEEAADRFALELLTGSADPQVSADKKEYTASTLANTVISSGPPLGIDPGVLALCLGHSTGQWAQSMGALKILQPAEVDVGKQINRLAVNQIGWDSLSYANQEYLEIVMGLNRES